MNKLLPPIVVSLLLSACATTAKYEQALNSWTGQNIDSLRGYPETFALAKK